MSDLVANHEDRFSHDMAQISKADNVDTEQYGVVIPFYSSSFIDI